MSDRETLARLVRSPYVSDRHKEAIREALAEVERLKADKRQSIEINAKLSSWYSTALTEVERLKAALEAEKAEHRAAEKVLLEDTHKAEAKIEAALAEITRTLMVPRPLRGSIATANRIERALKGE